MRKNHPLVLDGKRLLDRVAGQFGLLFTPSLAGRQVLSRADNAPEPAQRGSGDRKAEKSSATRKWRQTENRFFGDNREDNEWTTHESSRPTQKVARTRQGSTQKSLCGGIVDVVRRIWQHIRHKEKFHLSRLRCLQCLFMPKRKTITKSKEESGFEPRGRVCSARECHFVRCLQVSMTHANRVCHTLVFVCHTVIVVGQRSFIVAFSQHELVSNGRLEREDVCAAAKNKKIIN